MATIRTLSAFDAKSGRNIVTLLSSFSRQTEQMMKTDREPYLIIIVGLPTYSLFYLAKLCKGKKIDLRTRTQKDSVTEYVTELQRLAQNYNYGATLEQMLRDQIVCFKHGKNHRALN